MAKTIACLQAFPSSLLPRARSRALTLSNACYAGYVACENIRFRNVQAMWPSGNNMGQRAEGPEFESDRLASFLFFLLFSFSFLFSYCSFVLFLYIA